MPRSPARWLAPVALLAVVVTLFTVLGGSDEAQAPSAAESTATTSTGESTSTKPTRRAKPKRKRSTYTVKAGDTLQTIAESTGVPLETLQELNEDVDPTELNVGDKITLRG